MEHLPAPIVTFRVYQRNPNDSIGQFLMNFFQLWVEASSYGITQYEGISRLIELLPPGWRRWARNESIAYIQRDRGTHSLQGRFNGFVDRVISQFIMIGHPPDGPSRPFPYYAFTDAPWEQPIVFPDFPGTAAQPPPPVNVHNSPPQNVLEEPAPKQAEGLETSEEDPDEDPDEDMELDVIYISSDSDVD